MNDKNTNIFLIQEVIDDLMKPDLSLASPLIKLQYFSHLVKNSELLNYTRNEINGYDIMEKTIPKYRQVTARMMIDIQAYMMNNETVELPISMLPKMFQEELRYIKVYDGIATIENMAKQQINSTSNRNELMNSLPMEILPHIQSAARNLYKSTGQIDAVSAKLVGNSNIILEIPNAIRTRLLEFVMEISEKFGYDISIDTFNDNQEINNQIIINHMNTTINNSGDGNVINTGNENTIYNSNELYKGDISRLQTEFEKNGIDKADIDNITEIITKEEKYLPDNKLGEKSTNWILGIAEKSLKGIGKISASISSSVLGTIIKQYYGIE